MWDSVALALLLAEAAPAEEQYIRSRSVSENTRKVFTEISRFDCSCFWKNTNMDKQHGSDVKYNHKARFAVVMTELLFK